MPNEINKQKKHDPKTCRLCAKCPCSIHSPKPKPLKDGLEDQFEEISLKIARHADKGMGTEAGQFLSDFKKYVYQVITRDRGEVIEKVKYMLDHYQVTPHLGNRAGTFTPEQFMSVLEEALKENPHD